MTYYVLIPTDEITLEMLNRSKSKDFSHLPIKTINNQNYYIVEVEECYLVNSVIYDRYFRAINLEEINSFNPKFFDSTLDIKGIISANVNVGQTGSINIENNGNRVLKEVYVYSNNAQYNDEFSLEVLNADESSNKLLIDKIFMGPGEQRIKIKREYIWKDKLIKMTYKAVAGLITRNVIVNLFMEKIS